jgi:peptide/nickel transport system substrate-binding protein
MNCGDADGRRVKRSLLLLLLAVLAAACGGKNGGDTFTFGVAAEPASLDGAVAPDVESRRVISQIFEGLVSFRPGTTTLVPALATAWSSDRTGSVWAFQLRPNVRFQDGTPLDPAAVCFNFDRWSHLAGADRGLDRSYYWQRAFGGFAGEQSLYARCVTHGQAVELHLTRPNSAFLSALPLPAFSIASPTSLRGGSPVGTGPLRLGTWTHGRRLVLVRNDDYWGEPAKPERVVFEVIPSGSARLHALEAGEIDGYDLVAAQDIPAIEQDARLKLLDRPPFNVGYLTINQARPPMDMLLVRQAVAYGLDRQRLADSFRPRGSAVVASLFQPPDMFGDSPTAARYPYRPAKARRLLEMAGLKPPVPLEVWYPTDVSRPYLPDPAGAFSIIAAGLERAGFKMIAHTAPWNKGYLVRVDEGRAGQLNLVGWTGDFGDPNDFLGTLFSRPTRQFGFSDAKLFSLLARAEREPVRAKRTELYRQANERVLELLPGVPLVHTKELVALRADVQGYVPSPFAPEALAGVSRAS